MSVIDVLYVEDEFSLAKVTAETLRKNNFNITVAGDGQKALKIFRANKFDICVIDIMLPGMDGYKLVEEIRKTNHRIPLMFLTARTLTEDVVKGFETGANDYLKKPFRIEELIVRIKALVQRNIQLQVDKIATIELGLYNFNSVQMTLSSKFGSIQLTHRENEILIRLVSNKNQIVETKSILLELWGDDSFYNSRSLNVFITKLRHYLKRDKRLKIVNIRAVGYKLVVDTEV